MQLLYPSNCSRRLIVLPLLAAATLMVVILALSPPVVLGTSGTDTPVQGVTVSPGATAGELHIAWDAPSPAPNDYRVMWAPANGSFRHWSDLDWNAFPTEPEHTVSGLEPGEAYKVRVRARFGGGQATPWSEKVIGTAADVPAPQIVAVDEEPLIALQQVGHTSPATMDECGDLIKSGDAIECGGGRFSVHAVFSDGSFSINWSVWASQYDNITHYTVQHREFQYRNRFKHADTNEPFDVDPAEGDGWVVPGSCEAAVLSTNNMGQATEYWWRCDGLTNVYVDTEGNPTSVETDAENWQQTSWEGALASPSRKHDVPVTAMRIPTRAPTSLADELTQTELDDTVELTASETQMLLYGIIVHFDDDTRDFHYDLVTG